MTELSHAVDLALVINGRVSIKPYDTETVSILNAIDLWEFDDAFSHHITKFGDDSWKSAANHQAVTFNKCTPKLKFQLKAMTLGMHTQGAGEGMVPLSWVTIRNDISILKRFGCWLYSEYGISGLDELDHWEELKTRNMILKLVSEYKLKESPGVAVAFLASIYWVRTYKLINSPSIYDLVDEYLQPYVSIAKARKNKHSIIPPRILKIVLNKSELQIEKSQQAFKLWHDAQLNINRTIGNLSSINFEENTFIDVLSSDKKNELDKYHLIIKPLQSYVYTLVIAYTGMRYREAIALLDDAAFEHDGKYFLKTMLSKTTDDEQCLEWVTNKITHDAVKLLSKTNQVYRRRAKLLLEHHAEALPYEHQMNMMFGVKNKKLFNVKYERQSCKFKKNIKYSKKIFSDINMLFSIPVTDEDIDLLNHMNCNYQSICHEHKRFKEKYQVGDLFNFTAHQFRHTFAWFIVANRLGDLDDIKYQFKHLDSCMTYVYSQRGYESMDDLMNLTDRFSEFMISQAMTDMVQAAESGVLAGRGGESFMGRLGEILNGNLNTGNTPHFSSMEELVSFTSKYSGNLRGLSHGYCTKGNTCKVRNVADPSHCVFCDSYIATPKHLPHWLVIKQRCETQLQAFEKFPDEMKSRFLSFSTALNDNLCAANTIIEQLTIQHEEVKSGTK